LFPRARSCIAVDRVVSEKKRYKTRHWE
jgi:hypothetical protein